ncbi:hypothetical protein NEIRO03_0077 [Nematocida sp. AWRm78]|nr:hypothetical protein NEIRO02_2358 [Nematocida sp. AWRm79]KAI5182393.1 hypothetical protein NEIRO03_0077 [Nematocida sp. AWRm78]
MPIQIKIEMNGISVLVVCDTGAAETIAGKWLIPTRLTRKPNGTWRFCLDLKKSNDLVEQDNYPLPESHAIFDSMHGKKLFSVLDISNGFFRVPLRKEDRVKTTCKIGNKMYRMKVLPMGFKNSPAIFQRIMDTMLQEQLETGQVKVYIDDILIATKDAKEHLEVLQAVLKILKEHGMEINWDKVKLMREEVKFLGHLLSMNRIRPTDERIAEVMKLPPPSNLKQVRSFLGKVNYMSRHICDVSQLKAPLNELTKKGVPFVWKEEHQEAFMKIKSAVAKVIAVTIPDPNKKFTLETDASGTGMGAVLKQEEKVIGFYSTRLTATQQRYTITERELLAIVWAMDRCKHYLLGESFDVITDHKAIEAYFTKKDREFGNDRISRWMQALENFNFTPRYRPGEDMTFVDSLSRVYEGTSYESDAPSLMACVMAVMNELDQQILDTHIQLNHRKAILKDLAERNIKVTSTQLRNVLDTCRECLERDNQFMKHNRYIDTTEPGELMGVDLMEYQNRYVFVMIDYFSRMAFGVDLLKKDANQARSCIDRVFKAFPFKKIIVDKGREFDNALVKEWAVQNQVEIHYRPAYYHEGTGRIERLIQTVRKSLNRTRGPLRKKLQGVLHGYNHTHHRAVGMSPTEAAKPSRRAEVAAAVEIYKKEFGTPKEDTLEIGQKVLIRKTLRNKDDKHFEDEGTVVARSGAMSYQVKTSNGKVVNKNRNQLKLYK